MDAVAAELPAALGFELHWDQQTLGGFEHGLTPALMQRYDLVVFDHPFCGEIAQQQMFLPLEDACGPLAAADWAGASLESYRYAGHLWGLPIDGATQCSVYRADLLGEAAPARWSEVIALGQRLRRQGRWLVLPALSPHGLLVLLALCANLGEPWPDEPGQIPDRRGLREAMDQLQQVFALCHPDSAQMNAIHAHDAMVARDDLACCPLMYAYLTYAEADQRRPLRFGAFPGPAGHPGGSVLGGTGLGISRHCREPAQAWALVRHLADPARQVRVFMAHHGQPAAAGAWAGAPEDAAYGGAFAAMRTTMDSAWVRPRCKGYIGWQARAGELTQAWLQGQLDAAAFEDRLIEGWLALAR
jgi:multiple sugar transport system substrate-binding protein